MTSSAELRHSSYRSAGIIVCNALCTSPVFESSNLLSNTLIILKAEGTTPLLYDAIASLST